MEFKLSKQEYSKTVTDILYSSIAVEDKISQLVKLYEENDSLKNARDWARQKAFTELSEIDCPLCLRKIKMYHRSLNGSMSAFLIGLYNLTDGEEGVEVHYSDVVKKIGFMALDFSNLKRWGLIIEGQISGTWSITKKGILYVSGEISVPEKVHIYNDKSWGFSAEETTITKSIGKRFDLLELLKDKTFYSGDKRKLLK